MVLCLGISSTITAIAPWDAVSPLLLIRALIWLVGLTVLPGMFVLRLTGVWNHVSRLTAIALALNLSLVVTTLVGLAIYYTRFPIGLVPWVLVILLAVLGIVSQFGKRVPRQNCETKTSRWFILLAAAIFASILIALLVQVAQQFLIPGDVWVSLNPAVEVASQRNVFANYQVIQYPVMFGFTLSVLSACSGLPIVNTYVALFPLTGLNILSFFALVKVVFKMTDKTSAIAAIIYGFGGGLGWVIQTVDYHGGLNFWSLSLVTQDMYFNPLFWNSIMFDYKSLALTLAFSSVIAYTVSVEVRDIFGKFSALSLCSILMLSSFFIHVLEPIIFAPAIVAVAFLSLEGRDRYVSLITLAAITTMIGIAVNYFTGGFYYLLIIAKIESVLSVQKALVFSVGSLALILSLIVVTRSHYFGKIVSQKWYRIDKFFVAEVVGGLATLYFLGLVFWNNAPSPSLDTAWPFPAYLYVTRYGFIGGLAIFCLALVSWKEKWFGIACLWSALAIVAGSLWWGNRMNAYIFPMLALFAAVTVSKLWDMSGRPGNVLSRRIRNGSLRFLVKPFLACFLVMILIISFSSVFYGAAYYASSAPSLTDSEARAFQWVQQNVPQNATVLAPSIYSVWRGIQTIGDRQVYQISRLPSTFDATGFDNLTRTLSEYNAQYAISLDGMTQTSYLSELLLAYSSTVFRSGDVTVLKLPTFRTSSEPSSVAILNQELLGMNGHRDAFGWLDDNFSTGWSSQNTTPSSVDNGETLTLKWSYQAGINVLGEPLIKKQIPLTDTSKYPFLIVRYRDTNDTTISATNYVGQIVTLINETGYPSGFVTNFFLPVSLGGQYQTFVARLPQNQRISEIWVWMRNYGQVDGTIGLQMDYIGLSSAEFTNGPDEITFLSMALPALWPTSYSVYSDANQIGTARVVVAALSSQILDFASRTPIGAFLFLNATASIPTWGGGWTRPAPGIISGFLGEKRVTIFGTDTGPLFDQRSLTALSTLIYDLAVY